MARPATDIRARVLAAARDAFAGVGVEAASLRTIARAAGTSVAMVGYYFENKDGLFRAVIDDVYDGFLADLRARAAAEPDPLRRLRALLDRMAHVSPVELTMVATVLREVTVKSDRVAYVLARFLQGHAALLYHALEEAQRAGQIRPVPLPAVIPALVAPIVFPQLIMNAAGPLAQSTFAGVSAVALELVFEGLLPRPPVDPGPALGGVASGAP